MATKIRGITIELGADTSGIEKGLKDVNKDLKATQNELKDVDKLLKLDPKNTELLRQKQELLGKAIGQTKEKLETLKKAEKEAENQFKQGKISEDQYRAIKREVAETETNLRNLGKQADTANKKLSNVPETMNKIADKAKTAAQKTRGISLAAAGILTALGAGVYKTIQSADQINTLSKQSGISTERIQEYNYAADLIDVSTDSIIKAQQKLKKNMTSSNASTVAAFDKLGVKTKNANGELRDSSEVFDDVVAALSKVNNETERDTLAMELLGKGADELAGLIDDGGAAFKELAKEAHEAGAVLSQDSLNALNKTNDALDKLKNKASAALGQVADKLINNPKFETFLDKTTTFLDDLVGAIADMPVEKIETIVGILAGTAAVSPLASMIGGVAEAIGKVSMALGGAAGAGGLASAIGGAGGLTSALSAIGGTLATIAAPIAAISLSLSQGGSDLKTPEIPKEQYLGTFDEYRYGILKQYFGEDYLGKSDKDKQRFDDLIRWVAVHPDEALSGDIPRLFSGNMRAIETDFANTLTQIAQSGLFKTNTGYISTMPNTGDPYRFVDGAWERVVVNVVYNGDAAAIGQALEPSITAERQRRGGSVLYDQALGLTY